MHGGEDAGLASSDQTISYIHQHLVHLQTEPDVEAKAVLRLPCLESSVCGWHVYAICSFFINCSQNTQGTRYTHTANPE